MGLVVLALAFVPEGGHPALTTRAHQRRWRGRRACRDFAGAVARGDFRAADLVAAHVLEYRDRRDQAARAGRSRARDLELEVVEWDERKVFALSIDDVRRQFVDPGSLAFWFPGMERLAHDGRVDIVLGAPEPVRLRLVTETWTPELDGMTFTAGCPDFQIDGYLTFRTLIASAAAEGGMRTAVEVWVHMEATGSVGGRRALARARGVVHDGLGRMAAELNPL
jgi:hypothetical protein